MDVDVDVDVRPATIVELALRLLVWLKTGKLRAIKCDLRRQLKVELVAVALCKEQREKPRTMQIKESEESVSWRILQESRFAKFLFLFLVGLTSNTWCFFTMLF